MFSVALTFAAELHRDQFRKGTAIPYVSHLLGVASLALEHGADEGEAIAAVLHDAIEDQGGVATEATIHRLFGARVADIVRGCSDTDVEPKPPWRERKEAYLLHLRTADASTRLVSASDKLHNARAILSDLRAHGPALWTRFNAPPGDLLWYYQSLCAEFLQGGPRRLAEELARVVEEIVDVHKLQNQRHAK
ncbi:MAG: HD domain-containing protein [Dehalococcoidia bacterium]